MGKRCCLPRTHSGHLSVHDWNNLWAKTKKKLKGEDEYTEWTEFPWKWLDKFFCFRWNWSLKAKVGWVTAKQFSQGFIFVHLSLYPYNLSFNILSYCAFDSCLCQALWLYIRYSLHNLITSRTPTWLTQMESWYVVQVKIPANVWASQVLELTLGCSSFQIAACLVVSVLCLNFSICCPIDFCG